MVIVYPDEAWDHSVVLRTNCGESRAYPVAKLFPQRTLEAEPWAVAVVIPQVFDRQRRQVVPYNHGQGNLHVALGAFWKKETARKPTKANHLQPFQPFLFRRLLADPKCLPG